MKFLTSLMELTTSSFVRSLFETENEDQATPMGSVFFLGKEYLLPSQNTPFKKDVITRFWFTYRQGFEPIGELGPTSDQGWGCMLRCGQMMMAHTLICRHLGRDWLWDSNMNPHEISSIQALNQLQTYHSILRLFFDKKGPSYSVHQLTSLGASDGKPVGEWYGPNTIAHALNKASSGDAWSGVVVHVCMDNTVIIKDILDRCTHKAEKSLYSKEKFNKNDAGKHKNNNKQSSWKPLLLVIPLRLGVTQMNKAYYKPLKTFFELSQSVGVLGGRPNNAYWFVGYSDDFLLYFDPHTVQPISDDQYNIHSSYHINSLSRVHVSNLDPSIAAAFFCLTEDDFDDLIRQLKERILSDDACAVFEVHEARPSHLSAQPPLSTSLVSFTDDDKSGACAISKRDPSSNESDFELVNYDDEFEIIE